MRSVSQDAYLWQRHWNAAVVKALAEAGRYVHAWRVLAAEVDAKGHATLVAVDGEALRRTGNPVIAVIRADGRDGAAKALATATNVMADWKRAGIPLSGIEIDYDCATSRLGEYRDLLRTWKKQGLTLSITALPSWLESGELGSLLSEVDESVLQVHSVMTAKAGLFDKAVAMDWTRAWAKRSPKPFWIALPTYWSRVSWSEAGQVTAIESEAARYGSDAASEELFVDPREVSLMVAEIRQAGFTNMKGVAWFRLPTSEDQRAWSADTWHAVMEGRALPETPAAVRFKEDQAGARDVYLANASGIDGRLPAEVLVAAEGCEFADAVLPYRWERASAGVRFLAMSSDVLRAGQERPVGWVRCANGAMEGHVRY